MTQPETVEAPAPVVDRCAPGRKRHRYSNGGTCKFCPARAPWASRAMGSLADSIKAHPITSAPTPGAPTEGAAVLGTAETADTTPPSEPSAPSPLPPVDAAALPPVGVVEALPSAAPATPLADPVIAVMACTMEGHACANREEVARVAGIGERREAPAAAAFAEDMAAVQANIEALGAPDAPLTTLADDRMAEWIISKLLDREAQRKRIAIQADAMDRELANDIRGLAWRYGNALEEWTRRHLKGKARSFKTLHGTAGLKTTAARWSVEDARAVERWALAQDDPEKFGSYGFTLKPEAVLAYAKATGEAIPGLKLSDEREEFYVKGDVRVNVTKAKSAPALPEPTNPEEE